MLSVINISKIALKVKKTNKLVKHLIQTRHRFSNYLILLRKNKEVKLYSEDYFLKAQISKYPIQS